MGSQRPPLTGGRCASGVVCRMGGMDDEHDGPDDGEDMEAIDAFNALPERHLVAVPDDYPYELPQPGTDSYEEWLDERQPNREENPVAWKWWMKGRQARAAERKGGKPQKPPRVAVTAHEVEQRALEIAGQELARELLTTVHMLRPYRSLAAAKLVGLLESKDSADVKFAIKTILEMTDGKPAQTIIERTNEIRVVEYHTQFLPEPAIPDFVPGAHLDPSGDRLALDRGPDV